jgi:predicted permease
LANVLGDLWQDLRYAARLCLRQRGFAAAAVHSLALGIGVNTTMFTIVHGVLLRDLPYPEPDRLIRLVQAHSGGEVTMREHEIVKQHARTFEAVAAYRGTGERRLGRAEDQNWITTVAITTDFLRTFGVQPQIGREFTDEETRSGGPSAIILSDEVWRRVFDADTRILGRAIALNDTSATVVGVLPAGFWFPQGLDAALPLRNTGALDDTGTNTSLIARLRSDATIARAQSELGTMTEHILTVARAHLARDYRGLAALGFRDWVVGDVRENLLLLFGATGVLLLIACGNLALLLLTRFAARARELAVRAALGSSQRRTLAQLLTENLFLAAIGAAVGVVAAHALVRVFVSISPFASKGDDERAGDDLFSPPSRPDLRWTVLTSGMR